ncbi:hypothetical protein ATL39_0534 [Sinobaca qinghaiensis]|uniref:protein-tyrosine-phosphatase n=1 Tax=Sinobaca qinghaiensis TaxID=342944 RepID=A0A419V8M2_9BACL|nr:CpsB/CapC family capsule biosynthesis tyrosine phosphatase [Sinobaca qinghaiensis]RKD76318.1 hypothetical protein ATL39_0534 [Sinobaca qinghaiensis]
MNYLDVSSSYNTENAGGSNIIESSIYSDIIPHDQFIRYKENDCVLYSGESRYAYVDIREETSVKTVAGVLYDLQLGGHVPVILHPEQSDVLLEEDLPLYRFIRNGGLSLVDAASVTGENGKHAQTIALNMLRYNLAHFIGDKDTNTGESSLAAAYTKIQSQLSNLSVDTLKENKSMLLQGLPIEIDSPIKKNYLKKQRSWFSF